MQQNQPQNSNQVIQTELMKNIDSALDEAPPVDIMSGKILNEVMYYITPIISLVGFVLISVFGIFPNISLIMERVDAVNVLKEKSISLDERITKLEELRTNLTELTSIISKINTIVPEGQTEVVKFSQRIREVVNINMDRFAQDSGEPAILMNEIKTGELALTSTNATVGGLRISQIPTTFSFSGGFGRFRQFFINLYDGTDFFVVEKMQLSYEDESIWIGTVDLVKYQFGKDEGFNSAQAYSSVDEKSLPDQAVINFLKTKFIDQKLD